MENPTSIFIPGPSADPVGTAAGTAAGLALTPILGPLGPIAGSFLGGLLGGGGKAARPGGSNAGLGGALQSGIGSLFGSSSSNESNQVVNTDQGTSVTVSNVLGGRPFGNFNQATGEFDEFQALSDVFAIKEAQLAARLAEEAKKPKDTASGTADQGKKLNFAPLAVAGGLALVFILMRRS